MTTYFGKKHCKGNYLKVTHLSAKREGDQWAKGTKRYGEESVHGGAG